MDINGLYIGYYGIIYRIIMDYICPKMIVMNVHAADL